MVSQPLRVRVFSMKLTGHCSRSRRPRIISEEPASARYCFPNASDGLGSRKIKVGNERLFHRLLWASLVFAVAAAIVYLYQTRASLVLLFLSSAAQLATTLQIIYGAVEKISEDKIEIDRLNRLVGGP